MSDKPPIQKPPVRVPGGPSYPPPQPPPMYQPVMQPVIQPVYVPVPPPYEPPTTAPMTSFVSVLGWVSVIWAVGMVGLGFFLRFLAMDTLGESLANVSMWLSVVLIPLGMIGGLFALFELGREVSADQPKPTFLRLCLAAVMVCGGVGGQAWFSHYLTSSAAAILATRLHGRWERVSAVVNNPNAAWQHGAMKETKGWDNKEQDRAGHGEDSADRPQDIMLEFTPQGSVLLMRPGAPGPEQFSYYPLSASELELRRARSGYGNFETVQIEFLPSGDMLISVKNFWQQSDVLGRYQRFDELGLGVDLDPSVAGPWAESLTKLRSELATQEQKVKNLEKLAKRLEVERRDRTRDLNGYGVYSPDDLKGKGQAPKEISKELVDIGRQIEITRRKIDESEGMMVKIKSTLRQIARRVALAKAEMTTEDSEKLVEVKALLIDLGEQLDGRSSATKEVNDINEQVMLEKILKDQLHGDDETRHQPLPEKK